MMLGPLLATVEVAVNQLLRLDSTSLHRLAALEGKIIQVDIPDWYLSFAILPQRNGIQLLSSVVGIKPNCTINGKLMNLCQVFCQRGASAALLKNNIEVIGDIELAQQLGDIMQGLDIDWEELIARVLGDSVGQQVAWQIRGLTRFAEQAGQTLRQNITDYFQVEANHLPTIQQAEQFYADIASLRNDVERADARLQRLVAQLSTKKDK